MVGKPDVYASSVRAAGDRGAFFEYDGDVAYFYLVDMRASAGKGIVGAIHVFSGVRALREADVDVRWNDDSSRVGLFLADVLCAAFDVESGTPHGGSRRGIDEDGKPARIPWS